MFEETLIALGICVILPITLVFMILRARTKKMNRKMDILMKAVESGAQIDPALLVTAEEGDGNYRLKKKLLNRLMLGVSAAVASILTLAAPYCIGESWDGAEMLMLAVIAILAVGIGSLVSYFVGRRFLAKEIEAEEQKNQE